MERTNGRAQFKRMTEDEFLDWHERQEYRYELVNGFPIQSFPPKGMIGETCIHNAVAQNVAYALTPPARAKDCRPFAYNAAVRCGPHDVRYPDVVVDCGPRDGGAMVTSEPVIVAEVHSPTTTSIEVTDKLEGYRSNSSICVIMLIEPDLVSVKLYRRTDDAWAIERYYRLHRTIPLPEIGGKLPVADIYYGLDPEVGPDLAIVD